MFKVNIKDTRRRDFTKISPYLPTFCPDNTKKISILPSLMVAWGDEGEGGGGGGVGGQSQFQSVLV